MVALGTGIGGGLRARRAHLPRRARLRGRARAHGGRPRRRGLPRRVPGPRLPRGARVGHGDRARGRARRPARRPDSTLGRRLARRAARSPARWSPSWPTTATTQARDGAGRDRARGWAPGLTGLVNALDPEVVVIGGGAVAAGELLLGPARARWSPSARCRPSRARCGSCPAHFGEESGMLGAALLALEEGGAERSLVVCPTPIGNLEDVTLRVLSALREADVVACEDTRRTRTLLDRYGVEREARELPRAQRGGARGRARRARCGRATRWRSSPTPGMPLVSDPGLRAGAGVRGGRAAGGGAAGAVGGDRRAGGVGAARRPVALRGLPAAQEGRAASGCWRSRAARWWRSSRRAGCPARWRSLAELDPARQVAVCRELTKVHEEVVRGTRRASSPQRYAGAPPKGEVVLVLGPRREPAAGRTEPAGPRAAAPAGGGGRQAAPGGGAWWPSSPAASANALYRALTE